VLNKIQFVFGRKISVYPSEFRFRLKYIFEFYHCGKNKHVVYDILGHVDEWMEKDRKEKSRMLQVEWIRMRVKGRTFNLSLTLKRFFRSIFFHHILMNWLNYLNGEKVLVKLASS